MNSRYTSIQDKNSGPAFNDFVTSAFITKQAGGDFPGSRTSSQFPSSRRSVKAATAYALVPIGPSNEFYDAGEGGLPLQSTKDLTRAKSRGLLSSIVGIGFDTKFQCLLTIAIGIVCFLVCIICSIVFWTKSTGPPLIRLSDGSSGEALSFFGNLILTQCLEGLAYVHSISLRWALLKENRLVYNTNTRLITSSRLSRPNSWYINSISAALLVICYGATSILVMPWVNLESNTYSGTYINLVALLVVGLALFGQTVLSIWCYYSNLRDIPSWSSNPLNTTITMLNKKAVQHRGGRCMDSVRIRDRPEGRPMPPCMEQPNQWQASTSAKQTTILIWILAALSFIWFLIIVLIARSNMIGAINTARLTGLKWHFSLAWSPSTDPILDSISRTTYFNAVFFSLDPAERTGSGASMSFVAAIIVGLLFVCAIQGFQTLGLHCAELIVNLSRDEDEWRALDAQSRSRAKSHILETTPFLDALLSWKYIMLTIFKSLLPWLLGQSFQPSFGYYGGQLNVWFTMNYARLFVYAICITVFAAIITFLTFKKPKGPQPATYGHIQTIADLVDDWTLDEKGRFWWGDKGSREIFRHAGMSAQKENLGLIQMDALYAGEAGRRFPVSTGLSINHNDIEEG